MIKKTLYFGNPVYLSLKNAQLMIKLPEVVKNDTLPESFKRSCGTGSQADHYLFGRVGSFA